MPQHQQPLQFHQQMSGGLPQARQPQFTGQQNPFGQQQQQQQPQPQQQQQQLWMVRFIHDL
jgi:hypothetical protein